MKQHQYQVIVQHLEDSNGNPSHYDENIEFNVANHDDIFKIVEHLKAAEFFDVETTKAFAIGLKLFLEVMMTHPEHVLFKDLEPAMRQFMKNMKQHVKTKTLSVDKIENQLNAK